MFSFCSCYADILPDDTKLLELNPAESGFFIWTGAGALDREAAREFNEFHVKAPQPATSQPVLSFILLHEVKRYFRDRPEY